MRILTLSDKLGLAYHNGDILNPCFPVDYFERNSFPSAWAPGSCWLGHDSYFSTGERAAAVIPVQFLKPSEFVPIITCRN